MRRLVAWLLEGLPFDDRSRRALDETLLDWACEQGNAATIGQRSAVEVRALMSVARAAASSVAGDIARTPWRSLATRLCLVIGVTALALFGLSQSLLWPDVRTAAGTVASVELSALIATHELEVLLPALVFLAFAWPGRAHQRPAFGAAALALVAAGTFTVLIEPLANARFEMVVGPIWRDLHPGSTAGAVGPTLRDLHERVQWSPGSLLFGVPAFKLGLACLAGALALLAASIRAGRVACSARALALAPMVYLGALTLGSAGHLQSSYFISRSVIGGASLVAFAGVIALTSLRAARQRRWLLLVPGNVLLGVMLLPQDWLFLYRAFIPGPLPALLGLVVVAVAISARQSVPAQPHGAKA